MVDGLPPVAHTSAGSQAEPAARKKIYGMGMFDGLVLRRCLFVLHETLHATLYRYELCLIPSGVSVASLSAADTPGRSIFFGPQKHDK